jgi:hypothetical protein
MQLLVAGPMPRYARLKMQAHRSMPVSAIGRIRMLQVEGEQHPLKFSQVFHLMPVGGSFVVTNGVCATFTCLCLTSDIQ